MPENQSMPYGGTMAPLVVGDLVIAGVSGGDEGIRGFIAAYHVARAAGVALLDSARAVGSRGPRPGRGASICDEGGGATWLTGTYDPETGTLYLADRQSVSRHRWQPSARATTCTPTACSRSTRRPESSDGITSSRRTTCRTGMRRSRRCSSTHVPGASSQAAPAGEPQRLLLRARSHRRRVASRRGRSSRS